MLFNKKKQVSIAILTVPSFTIIMFALGISLEIKPTTRPIDKVEALSVSHTKPDEPPDPTISSAPDSSPKPDSASAPKTPKPTSQASAPQKTSPTNPPTNSSYPWHENITATVFWVGEGESNDNGYIHNRSSAWMTDWMGAFGGLDDPDNRCGYNPCGFTPKENSFYFALPYGDYTESGLKANLSVVPWYKGLINEGDSILKNRWIEIRHNGKMAYAQWEDVGPFEENDSGYVFGNQVPKLHVGLDVSPATRDYLQMGGKSTVSWRFIEQSNVPSGPWKNKVTTTVPAWN